MIYCQRHDGSYVHDTPPEIIYHAPVPHGTKPRQFKNLSEMSGYLTNKASTLTWHNFSFRKEVMGAAPDQEVVRGRDEKVDLFPQKEPQQPQTPPTQTTIQGEKNKPPQNSTSKSKCKQFLNMLFFKAVS